MTAVNSKVNPNAAINIHATAPTAPTEPTVAPHVHEHGSLFDSKRSLWTIGAIIVVCVISGILIGSYVTMKLHPTKEKSSIWIADQSIYGCPQPLQIVTRSGWGAEPPKQQTKLPDLPFRVIIAHTATPNCTNRPTCESAVKMIQDYHLESKLWDDIGYNFLVGGDGSAYVGRGWDLKGAHTLGYNAGSIGIAFIGQFDEYPPTKQQLCAARQLIAEGVKSIKLTQDYNLYGHRQLRSTKSPGDALYEIITTWDHWTDIIY